MKYRPFGRTGWSVSEIAFGGWQLGGQWGATDDEASTATLLHAFEQGVNFVDTAEYYGEGHSEEVIGEALSRWDGAKSYGAMLETCGSGSGAGRASGRTFPVIE